MPASRHQRNTESNLCQRNLTQKLTTWPLLTCQELNHPVNRSQSEQKVWCQGRLYAVAIKEIALKKIKHKTIHTAFMRTRLWLDFPYLLLSQTISQKDLISDLFGLLALMYLDEGHILFSRWGGNESLIFCAMFCCSITAHSAGRTRLPLLLTFRQSLKKYCKWALLPPQNGNKP